MVVPMSASVNMVGLRVASSCPALRLALSRTNCATHDVLRTAVASAVVNWVLPITARRSRNSLVSVGRRVQTSNALSPLRLWLEERPPKIPPKLDFLATFCAPPVFCVAAVRHMDSRLSGLPRAFRDQRRSGQWRGDDPRGVSSPWH
eukprot:scaffold2277_cov256-Pinguiococcus_pyrenoidosus.AAC.25